MEIFRKSGVAGTFTVPLIDTSKRPSYKLNPTIVAGDVKVIRHTGGAWDVSDIDVTPGVIPGSTSNVLVELTDVELTPDDLQYPIIVQFIDQTAIKEWDDQTVIIWTQEIASDLAKIDGDPVTDNSATLTLKTLTVINPAGHAIDLTPGENYHGIHIFGGQEGIHAEGTNHGVRATSASAPLSGAGFLAEGGGGPGIEAVGDDGHPGIYGRCVGAGQGAKFVGNGGVEGVLIQGAAEADGLKVSAGATSGFGIRVISPGGHGISVTSHASYNAVDLIGGLVGLYAKGTNHGAHFTSVDAPLSGAGLLVEGGGGPGLEAIGDENFPRIHAHSVGGTGHGILSEGINDGCGLKVIGGVDGSGLHVMATNMFGIHVESEQGGGVNIQGNAFGATIMGMSPYTAALFLVGGVRVLGSPELPAVDIQGAGTNSAVKITSGGDGIEIIGAEASYDINAKELKGLLRLDSPIDSVPTSDVLELVLAMVNGRFVKDPEAGTITFYKRDNNAVLFTVEVSETERARL